MYTESTQAIDLPVDRLILALDFHSGAAALNFLEALQAQLPDARKLRWVKVGLELFLSEGPSVVARLRELGYQVFLDLKLHDIPNTVAGAVRSVLPLQPALLTLHGNGGSAMLAAAAEAAAGSTTRLLAVTVLTSLGDADLSNLGISETTAAQVSRLARLSANSGVAGLVCSPLEVHQVRENLPNVHIVTPGIRPSGSNAGDQQRAASPAEAIAAGSSQLVIGRPITAAERPARAVELILDEIEAGIEIAQGRALRS